MWRTYKLIAIVAAVVVAVAIWWTHRPTPAPIPVVTAPTDITLAVGQKGSVDDLDITFNSMVQDNRCPVDIHCDEGGAVTINVTFTKGTQTVTKNMPSDEVPQQFAGYAISILKTAPDRMTVEEIPPNAYTVTFHVGTI